jgi:hypothetical protein
VTVGALIAIMETSAAAGCRAGLNQNPQANLRFQQRRCLFIVLTEAAAGGWCRNTSRPASCSTLPKAA